MRQQEITCWHYTLSQRVQRTLPKLIAGTLCLQGTETLTEASAKQLLLQWQDVKTDALGMSRADAMLLSLLDAASKVLHPGSCVHQSASIFQGLV